MSFGCRFSYFCCVVLFLVVVASPVLCLLRSAVCSVVAPSISKNNVFSVEESIGITQRSPCELGRLH